MDCFVDRIWCHRVAFGQITAAGQTLTDLPFPRAHVGFKFPREPAERDSGIIYHCGGVVGARLGFIYGRWKEF